MTDLDPLSAALADRYTIERELGGRRSRRWQQMHAGNSR
jgi:hypothetical protein